MLNTDNIIQLVFDKIFRQITGGYLQLKTIPFAMICSQTFENDHIYKLINKLTFRPITQIESYLKCESFKYTYLFSKLKNKIDVNILLGRLDQIEYLVLNSYQISPSSLNLAVINGNLSIVKYLIHKDIILDTKSKTELLTLAVEFSFELVYMYLRELEFDPNIKTYNKAVSGSSIKIVQDVDMIIGLSKRTVDLAFEFGTDSIIEFITKEALDSNIQIQPKLISYPILNADINLVERLSKLILKEWDPTLMYSAVLSGSIPMIKWIESQIPNVHSNLILDTSQIRQGQSSLFLSSMTYEKNHKQYFSHMINYAVQSKSIDVVKYIHNLGYEITLSNIINGIQTGELHILEYLLQNFNNKLPVFLINYFHIDSYLVNKIPIVKLLIAYGFDLHQKNNSLGDYQLDTAHLNLILGKTSVKADLVYDTDYLMNYQAFFIPPVGFKLNRKLITKVRICVELDLESDLDQILNQTHHIIDQQFIMDGCYLFGKISHIKKVYSAYQIIPSMHIIMEMMCWGQIGKLAWLLQLGTCNYVESIYRLSLVLDDPLINGCVSKFNFGFEPDFKSIVTSGKSDLIVKYYNENNPVLDLDLVKQICLLDDINLAWIVKPHLDKLSDWLIECDLRDIYRQLHRDAEYVGGAELT